MAVEAADVTLFTEDLCSIPPVLSLARRALRKIWENIGLSVVVKIAVLALAATGNFTLWGAVLADVGVALIVIANGLTLLRWYVHYAVPIRLC